MFNEPKLPNLELMEFKARLFLKENEVYKKRKQKKNQFSETIWSSMQRCFLNGGGVHVDHSILTKTEILSSPVEL